MEYLDELIAKWCALHDKRKTIDKQLDALADLIKPEMAPSERRNGVTVVAPTRFSASLAKERLTADDYDRICEQRPSASKAARLLGSDVVELCKEPAPSFLRRSEITDGTTSPDRPG